MSDNIPPDLSDKGFKEIMFYKMDRTLAIIGIITLGCVALLSSSESQLTMAAISGLVGYVGGRTAK